MRLIFMGSPRFAVPTLEALLAAGHEVALVVSQPDQPAGRGQRLTPPPVAQVARQRGLPLLQPATPRDPAVQAALAAVRPDAIVVAAYGRLLPRAVLDLPPLGCLNVHPSLLPRWRGPAPIQGALLAGDPVTGTSIILLEERMDAGPILAQAERPIGPDDDAVSLEAALAEQGAALLVETLPRWAAGQLTPRQQDEAQATYTRLLTKADGLLDWTRPAPALANQVRACAGWPGAYTFWRGQVLKVLRAAPLAARPPLAPGTVWAVHDGAERGVAVAAGEGSLLLREVALAGRRPTPATAFVQGYRDFLGARLGS
ncbi:MAG TPA: methionyl-tRNA formyltransferase [Chloroflexota bacterium]|nr:methionyl-tRNA formyltransferase [Chloroflexota bacterium]